MDVEQARREKAQIEERHGPWTAHNVRLADGVYTISPEPAGDESKLARVVQLVADLAALAGRPVAGLRVLDLASLEGMYALELAARGAEVVAIEGREANRAKAEFAARALGLDSVEFRLGDVRDLSRERDGEFDVVLCLGILYHLDAPDAFRLVEQIASVSRLGAVFDTWVAAGAEEARAYDGETYRGVSLFEHEPEDAEDVRQARVWSSLDNPRAFAPTLPSLLRLLAHAGFTTALECHLPPEGEKPAGRITLLTLKGRSERPLLVPEAAASFPPEPEAARGAAWRGAVPALRKVVRRGLRRPSRRL